MPAAVSDGQIKAPEAPLYEQLLCLPARQRPAHDGGSAQESTNVPKIFCVYCNFQELSLFIVGCWIKKEYARSGFVEKTAGEGRQEVLVGASFVS